MTLQYIPIDITSLLFTFDSTYSTDKLIYDYCYVISEYMFKHLHDISITINDDISAVESTFKIISCTPNKLELEVIKGSDKIYYTKDYINDANDNILTLFICPSIKYNDEASFMQEYCNISVTICFLYLTLNAL